MWWYLLLLVGVMLFLSPSTSGTSIFCWLEACDGASVPSNSIWKHFWCFQGSYEKQFWYFQVLPRQGYEKYSWYLRSNMKLVVERGSRHLGHNGCQEAEVYSRGTRSHRHLQIQIHKYTNTPWKGTKYCRVDFKHKYKYKWRQGIMRFYTIFSYLIQITPQSDNNNKIWAEIQIWAQIQIWAEIQTQSKEFGGCW